MPLDIQIPYRGDQYLFQGISGAGASIGEGMEQMMKRMKQTKAVRNMAVDGLGMDPDAVDKMSLEEVQGHLQGAALKNAQQEAQARRMMEEAHGNYYNRFNQKAAREDAFSAEVNRYMQPQAMAPGEQGPPNMPTLDPQTLMRLEAQAGTLDPDKAMQYMKQLDERNVNWDMVKPHEMTTSGGNPVIFGKSGQFQFEPPKPGEGPQMSNDGDFYFDGKKWVAAKNRDMTDTDRAKIQAQYEKNIDTLIGSYSFAKGDPEMEALIKERIASHRTAIGALNSTTPPPGDKVANALKPRKPMGGYKIDTVYAGMKYLGGDPKDSASWEKVK